MKRRKKVIYYDDPINDDFAGTNIHTKKIDEKFSFLPTNILWRAASFMLYYFIAIPIVFVYMYIICGFRIKNALCNEQKCASCSRKSACTGFKDRGIQGRIRRFAKIKGKGCFMYINHTHFTDAFIPAITAFPKRAFVITGPDAVSIPAIRHITKMLGCIPIPVASAKSMSSFMEAVHQRAEEGYCIGIFPEAHIWPYCSFIRPYKETSFRYPAMWRKPVLSVCVTYQPRRGLLSTVRRPRRTVYVSDIFYPNDSWNIKENRRDLYKKSYNFMCKMSECHSTYAYIEYTEREAEENREENREAQPVYNQ